MGGDGGGTDAATGGDAHADLAVRCACGGFRAAASSAARRSRALGSPGVVFCRC